MKALRAKVLIRVPKGQILKPYDGVLLSSIDLGVK